ncbi:MAG: sugar phosphate isomerase/epimerase [Firmicutes bacterium]|nr:sugar phosphate isomerase/epimerase [Bacillota bacterium]
MQIGFLTGILRHYSLVQLVEWASQNGFGALEIYAAPGNPHIDPAKLSEDDVGQIKELLSRTRITISSLAYYANPLDPDPEKRAAVIAHLKKLFEACSKLDVPVVCTMAGMPVPGKDRLGTIREDMPEVFSDLVRLAGDRGLKIALENWYPTLLQNLECWDAVFEAVPAPNLGLNFDPSHLYHQQVDYLWAVEKFSARIFHAHAKDTAVLEHRLRYVGNQAGGWWRYCIPGYGEVRWPQFISALKAAGFDGALSIEHEDGLLGKEEGLLKGKAFLERLI